MLLPEATTAVAAGSQHTLMLAESGDLWAVGNNRRGQLGLGKGSSSISHWPHRIPALVGKIPLLKRFEWYHFKSFQTALLGVSCLLRYRPCPLAS